MCVEQDVAAVIVLDNARCDVVSAHIGGCVEVRDKSDGGYASGIGICRECRHEVSVVVEGDVGEAHLAEFVGEVFGEGHLPGCGGRHVGEFVALGVVFDVPQKSVYYVHGCVYLL